MPEDRTRQTRENNPEFFQKTSEIKFNDAMETVGNSIKDQSDSFQSMMKTLESGTTAVFEASTRGQSKVASDNLDTIKRVFENETSKGNLSEEETGSLQQLIDQADVTNKALLQNEHSMKSAMGDSLKENLPNLAGILGTIGLDNPAFMFMGSMLQSIMDKRRDQAKEREKLEEDFHADNVQRELDAAKKQEESDQVQQDTSDYAEETEENTSEVLDAVIISNALLDNIKGMVNSMTKASEASAFEEIEKRREQETQNENLLNAINSIDTNLETPDSLEDQGGLLEMMGLNEMYQSFMMSLGAIGAFLATAGKKLLGAGKFLIKGVARFAGPIGLIVTAGLALKGAAEGWNNAAEKLNKDASELTFGDKLASAMGGAVGSILSIFDDISSFFGFETDVGGFMNQKITEISASIFGFIGDTVGRVKDFFANIFTISFPEGFSIGEMMKAPVRLLWGWWKALFNLDDLTIGEGEDQMSIADFVETKTTELLNNVKAFFTDLYDSAKGSLTEKIDKIKEIFNFELELPDFKKIISDFFGRIMDVFKNFSITDTLKKKMPSVFDSEAENNTEDLISNLDKKGAVNERFGTKDKVTDWEAINKLNKEQLGNLAKFGDFDDKTKQKINEMVNGRSQVKVEDLSPKAALKEKSSEYMKQETTNKEKDRQNVMVNAPKSSNVSNVNNNSNSYYPRPQAKENDQTLNSMGAMFSGAGM